MEETDIQKFYKNKTVFVTGGTGFLGKALIEKLLRATDLKCLYVLIRPKSGKPINDRLNEFFSNEIFEELKRVKPSALERVVAISGDCGSVKLGLSEMDRKTLIDEVNIITHLAATVRFDERLSVALQINLQATVDLIEMAKEAKNLEAFVHTSSAFANCQQSEIEEKYYSENIGTTSEDILQMLSDLGPKALNEKSRELCNHFPNTYTYTKALAEEAVIRYGQTLPICIFRPGIVMATYKEPVPGWTDNSYGPMGMVEGAMHGIVRVILVDVGTRAGIVPVDSCANQLLACAWYLAKTCNKDTNKDASLPPIFNLVSNEGHPLTWSIFVKHTERAMNQMPLASMFWFPFLVLTRSKMLFEFFSFVYQTLPAYVLDLSLLVRGKKTRMVKLYRKINRNFQVYEYFTTNNFSFSVQNTLSLWNCLSKEDKELFHFNINDIDWVHYIHVLYSGIRLYLGKEKPETVSKGKEKLKRYRRIGNICRLIFYGFTLSLLNVFVYKIF